MSRSHERLIRQWHLIETLRPHRRGLTMSALVEQTRIPRSTVYRYIDFLVEAGVPLVRDRVGDEVRHRLMDVSVGGQTLEAHEIGALVLARELLQPLEGLRAVDALDGLLRRLARWHNASPSVTIVCGAADDNRGTLRAIDLAIRNGNRLAFDYRGTSAEQPQRRRVDPVSLRVYRGAPYLVAHDVDRDDWRVFKLARIEGEISLEGDADPHPDYDEEALFEHSVGIWSGEPVEVAIRLSAEVAGRAREYPLTGEQTIEAQPDGSVIVRARVSGTVEVLRWTLSWGAAAEVLEPVELQEDVVAELGQAIRNYEKRHRRKTSVSHM